MTAASIAILGGGGALGLGLAGRFVAAGHPVIIGSRDPERTQAVAAALSTSVRVTANVEAAREGHIVVLAVPFSAHDALLGEIANAVVGKIVIDAVVPLVPPKVSVVQLPPEGSATSAAHHRLAGARVVGAFHNVSASKLAGDGPIACDVLVCGDDVAARAEVIALIAPLGMRGVDAGPVANAVAAEALTALLIGINRRYKVQGAGIKITGLGPTAEGGS